MKNNKYLALAAFFGVVAFFGIAIAGVTGYGSIMLKDSPGLIQDSGGTTRIALATSGSNVTLTGNVTYAGSAQPIAFPASFITLGSTIARSTGTIAFTSGYVMYVATGTGNANQWVKIGAQ